MKFVVNAPAAVVGAALVVSDVHLGIEYELQQKGVRLFPQPKKEAKKFNDLLRKTHATELVVLGDLKHDCRGFEEREKKMMAEFLAHLNAEKTVVCKGNHDSQLEEISGIQVVGPQGFVLRSGKVSYGLHHGHAWPGRELLKADFLLMGNNHPTIEFVDASGHRTQEKAWVKGEIKQSKKFGTTKQKAIVFPAFSQLSGGTAFNRHACNEMLGPLFKNNLFDLEHAEAFLLNGVRLGRIKDLRKATGVSRGAALAWKKAE